MVYFTDIRKLYLFTFFTELFFMGAISVPFFLEWGKINYTQLFILQAWFMAWIFLLEIPTGVVADRIGRKHSLSLSGIIGAIAVCIYVISPNFYIFLLAEFLMALTIAFCSGADTALIYEILKKQKKEKQSKYIFSKYKMFNTLGTAVGLPIGSVIAGLMVWPYPDNLTLPFLLTSIPFAIAAILAISIKENKRPKFRENYLKTAISGIKYFAGHKKLKVLTLDMILVSGTTFFMYWFYQSILGKAGFSVAVNGFVSAGFNATVVLLLFKMKSIEKVFGVKNILFLSALIPGIFYLGLAFTNNIFFVFVAIFAITSLRGLRAPVFNHYMNFYIKKKQRATILSTISMFDRLFMVILYPIVGILSDISLEYTFLVLGLLTIIFAVVFRTGKRILNKR